MKKILTIVAVMMIPTQVIASELVWGFKSPAFHYGNGYSTHVLSVEQLSHNRKQDYKDEQQRIADELEREAENTTLAKFLRNVESRIYATLSKQMVDAMFADCGDSCSNSGSTDLEDNTIAWLRDPVTGSITLTITEADGSTTEITIPGAGEFNF
jgi:hypothetical protein